MVVSISKNYSYLFIIFACFLFSASQIKITAPKSKQKLKIGSNFEIKWKTKKNLDKKQKVKIFISYDNGNNWSLIAITQNDGLYNWDVPGVNSNKCLLKIESIDASFRVISNKEFKIDGPAIKIISPLANDVYSGGDKAKILWESQNIGNELINILYSINNGKSWILIAEKMVDTGLFVWDIPHYNKIYYNCLIKIATNSGKINKTSQSFTVINESNKIRIQYPNGGELIEAGSAITINWETDGLNSNLFKILFSSNSGATWERVKSRLLNKNQYLWRVPELETKNCLIKIIAVENESIYDISEYNFTITKKPSIKISSPLQKQTYYSNEDMQIKWNSVNVLGKKVNIYYSDSTVTKWITIKRSIPNNGTYNWKIPDFNKTSDFLQIKLELSNNIRIKNITDNYFTIYGTPLISFSSNNNSTNKYIEDKSIYKVIWNSKNIKENRVNLFYSINAGTNWKLIQRDIPNNNFYDWFIPGLKNETCIFKVESSVQNEIFAISNSSIDIIGKPLILFNTSVDKINFESYDSLKIEWDSYNLADQYIDISYSLNNDKKWILIHDNILNHNYKNIIIPFVPKTSDKCKIKVSDSYGKNTFAISNGFFKINRPKGEITLLENNKKIYNYNESMHIKWSQTHMQDKIGSIYYSLNKEKKWIFITDVNLLEGFYNWDIPDIEDMSNNVMLKVDIANSEYIYADSLKIFTINPAPFFTIKNSLQDTVKTNMPFLINVAYKNIKNPRYDLSYSLTKGLTWVTIDKNINTSTYSWNVPTLKGYKNILLSAVLNANKELNDRIKLNVMEQSINLAILSPNGSESYNVGDDVKIVWSIKKMYDKTIDLYYSIDNGINWEVIKLSAKNSGKYNWKIDQSIISNNNCKIKVQSNISRDIFDVTDGPFTIKGYEKVFNIITPNNGETIKKGTSTFIYWETLNDNINKVDIYYSSDNGKNWFLIKEKLSNKGKYNWQVSTSVISSKNCFIKIVSSSNNMQLDLSDKPFTLK